MVTWATKIINTRDQLFMSRTRRGADKIIQKMMSESHCLTEILATLQNGFQNKILSRPLMRLKKIADAHAGIVHSDETKKVKKPKPLKAPTEDSLEMRILRLERDVAILFRRIED